MASRLAPVSRFIDRRLMAKARPSHPSLKAGSVGSKWTFPQPCIPPMSWIPSTTASLRECPAVRRRAADGRAPESAVLSDRPGVDLEGAPAPGGEGRVEDVERVERLDPLDQVVFPEPVEGAHGEPAGVDRRPFLEEGLDLVVDGQVAGEGLLVHARVAAGGGAEEHPGAVEDDADVEALADEAGRGQQVDQRHGTLVGDAVDEDEGLLAGVGPDVPEDLLLDVVQDLAVGRTGDIDGLRHWYLLSVRC